MAGAPILGGSGPEVGVAEELSARVVASLRDRYLVRYLDQASPRQLTLESHPGKEGAEDFAPGPYYSLWYENVCQMPDVHATVMQTDLATEVNLTAVRTIAESVK
jgi:hypothetical protein